MNTCFLAPIRPTLAPVAAVLLALAGLSCGGCGGGTTPAPTSFKTWNAKDGTFQLEYPSDWEAKGGGKQGVQWARITHNDASIHITVSLTDSLIGSIAESGGGMGLGMPGEGLEELSPAAQVHAMKKDIVAEDEGYKKYQEVSGEKFQPQLGEAWRSEFTATMGFGKQVHGYRATILAHDKGVTVLCHCSEASWANLQPAFLRILDGMKMGVPR